MIWERWIEAVFVPPCPDDREFREREYPRRLAAFCKATRFFAFGDSMSFVQVPTIVAEGFPVRGFIRTGNPGAGKVGWVFVQTLRL